MMEIDANVYYNGIEAGVLKECYDGSYIFTYNLAYFVDDSLPPISLCFSKKLTQYFSANLFSCFRGLLSTGITREIQCSHFKIPLDDDFQLLLRVCSSDTTGALTIR